MGNKYNLYRVERRDYGALLKSLENAGFTAVGAEEEIRGFSLQFYLGEGSPKKPQWVDLYRRFLKDADDLENRMQSAALLIYNAEHCYVVGIGRAYIAIQQVCDKEFGLNLAERIVDEEEVKQKASKFFQSQRSKSIQSFVKNNPFVYDSGESVSYLKAKTKDKNLWGERAEFGTSFRFSTFRDPGRLPELIEAIIAKLQEEVSFQFPRTEKVSEKEVLEALDQLLASGIMAGEDSELSERLEFDDFQLNGCDFRFSDAESFAFYVYGRKKATLVQVGALNLQTLVSFIKDNELDESRVLNQVRVAVMDAQGGHQNLKLKDLLDVVVEKDDKSYCLLSGAWFKFSHSYLDYLNGQIDQMDFVDAGEFNFEKGEEWTEDDFLDWVAEEGGYHKFHQTDFSSYLKKLMHRHNVELMDLYKDHTLFVVKRGKPQKLGYACDQGVGSVNLLKEMKSGIPMGENKRQKPKAVCLWLVMDRAYPIKHLSDIKSTIFKMKLVEFKRITQDAGLRPEIQISYEYEPKHRPNYPAS